MTILVAPDKFKGTLSACEVAENIAVGLSDVLPDAKIDIAPLADGGEGTAEVISQALGGSWLTCKAHDPLGREIDARYACVENAQKLDRLNRSSSPRFERARLAIMEMSEAAGMRRLAPDELDPLRANTFGVAEMILDAAHRGVREIIIGLGGSATNDGGFGMARSLGFEFSLADGMKLDGFKPSSLRELERIERPRSLKLPPIVAAVDVKNPLLGENGATRVFGPQKGATAETIDLLERVLARLADVIAEQFGFDYRNEPGAGAAGGLGFGLMSFCGAKVRPGFDVVAEAVGLEAKMKDVDLVITGEGSLDRQTLEGKTPAGVARLARKLGKRVFAIVGRASEDRQAHELFDGVYQNARPGMSEKENMARAAELLRENARELAKCL
jgi:glycerate 2-kinase